MPTRCCLRRLSVASRSSLLSAAMISAARSSSPFPRRRAEMAVAGLTQHAPARASTDSLGLDSRSLPQSSLDISIFSLAVSPRSCSLLATPWSRNKRTNTAHRGGMGLPISACATASVTKLLCTCFVRQLSAASSRRRASFRSSSDSSKR